MAMFNYLMLTIICPRCGAEAEMEADFRFGLRDLTYYRIGDRLRWDGMGVKTPETRPEDGNYDDEAYVVCPHCELDFWLAVSVRHDIIARATVDTTKQPYISTGDRQPQATIAVVQSKWYPRANAEYMKKTTSPPVSAFFMIDSPDAIQRCIQWLSLLKPYNLPDMQESLYFKEVSKIYNSRQKVVNFDYDFVLLWQGKEYPEKLRCHFFDEGRYEIELELPGVVANELADQFKDGHEGFFCAFMSHAFYD